MKHTSEKLRTFFSNLALLPGGLGFLRLNYGSHLVWFGFAQLTIKKFLKSTNVFTLAENLGGTEGMLCHPSSMTHAAVPKEDREKFGLTSC